MKRRDTGIRGEKLARDFLKRQGYRIIETNYRCPEGEIDIIARHKDFLVFVEVRTKTSLKFGKLMKIYLNYGGLTSSRLS